MPQPPVHFGEILATKTLLVITATFTIVLFKECYNTLQIVMNY